MSAASAPHGISGTIDRTVAQHYFVNLVGGGRASSELRPLEPIATLEGGRHHCHKWKWTYTAEPRLAFLPPEYHVFQLKLTNAASGGERRDKRRSKRHARDSVRVVAASAADAVAHTSRFQDESFLPSFPFSTFLRPLTDSAVVVRRSRLHKEP